MDVLLYLQTEFATLSKAPFIFLVGAALVASAAWALGRFQSGEQISNLESRIALRDDKIADYERKLEGASPDEAAALVASLEKRLAAFEPRSLSPSQIEEMANVLRQNWNKVMIMVDMRSPESNLLARQLRAAFKNAGWEVEQGSVIGDGDTPPSGVGLVSGIGNSTHSGAEEIKQALAKVGLAYDLLPNHPEGSNIPLEILLTAGDLT